MTNDNKKLNKINSRNQANLIKALESIIPQYSEGGQIMSTLLSVIPGIGPIAGPLLGAIDQAATKPESVAQKIQPAINSNPYGQLSLGGYFGGPGDPVVPKVTSVVPESTTQKVIVPVPNVDMSLSEAQLYTPPPTNVKTVMYEGNPSNHTFSKKVDTFREKEFGGIINEGFKQYDTGSHRSGQDLSVDQNGNPSANATASVQNKENMFSLGGKPYVMSDVLINPETGNTFNKDAAKLNKKYPEAKTSFEDNNTLKFGMDRLSKLNDFMRQSKEDMEKACGGMIKKLQDGGPIDPLKATNFNFQTAHIPVSETYDGVPRGVDPFSDLQVKDDLALNTTFNGPLNNGKPAAELKLGQNTADRASKSISEPKINMPKLDFSKMQLTSNNVAVALKGLGLIKSMVDAGQEGKVEDPILPDYNQSDAYLKSANVNYDAARNNAMGAANIAANVNRSASSNFAQFQGRELQRAANLSNALSNIGMQENNAQSQLNITKANYEQNKAVDTANRLYQNRIDNMQNEANAKYAKEKLFTELTQIGTEFNKYNVHLEELKNNKELANYYIKEGTMLLNSQNNNFKLDPDFVNKLKAGASFDELVKFYPNEVVKLKEEVDKNKGKNGNN